MRMILLNSVTFLMFVLSACFYVAPIFEKKRTRSSVILGIVFGTIWLIAAIFNMLYLTL